MNLTSRFTSWKTLEDLYDEETGMEESNYLPTKIPSKSKNSLKNPIKKNFNVHSSRMNVNPVNMKEANFFREGITHDGFNILVMNH